MNTDVSISACKIAKRFKLFHSRKHRLTEALHPFRKRYHDEFWALKDITFDINRGEVVGILGRNGSGKSTILQIICSVMAPTYGHIQTKGRISALLELGTGFNPEFTGRSNVLLNGALLGISREEMLQRLPEIEAFADIGDFFDQPMKFYSSGMFVRVSFAAAIHVDPDILVIDEVLSVGDAKFQHRCFQRIREFMEQGKTILVVSHDTDTLLRICHRGIVFDKGMLGYIGQMPDAVNHYQELLFGGGKTNDNYSKSTPKFQTEVLSGDSRDKIFEKVFYNEHETRFGSGSAKIIDFDIFANGALNPPEIPVRAQTELIVKIAFEESLDNFFVGFAVIAIDGTYAFGTNLDILGGQLLSGVAGEIKVVKFRFISHFVGGEYFLNIGCNHYLEGEDQYVDIRRSVARLRFSDTPKSNGFVNLDIDHETIEISKFPTNVR